MGPDRPARHRFRARRFRSPKLDRFFRPFHPMELTMRKIVRLCDPMTIWLLCCFGGGIALIAHPRLLPF